MMMGFLYITGIVSVVALAFAAVDLWHVFYTWQARINIGRYDDLNEWRRSVITVATRWLKKTPAVPCRATDRLILLDMLFGRRSSGAIQSWQKAGLVLALSRIPGYTFDARIIRRLIAKHSETRSVDRALLAYALMRSPYPVEIRREVDEFAHSTRELLEHVRGENATIPYRQNLPDIRFVDTLGFVCPFLFAYAAEYGDAEAADLAEQQLREYADFLHPDIQLPPHAYDVSRCNPMGVYDWGRGFGWYILAIVESYRILESSLQIASPALMQWLRSGIVDAASRMIALQHADGGFSAFLNDANGRPESSATALCAMLLGKAYAITEDCRYLEAADRSLCSLMHSTRRDGAIDFCQGDTMGIGYYSSDFNIMPFAQGMAVVASEYLDKE